jgi:predicted ArsR family transcriptional regulator
MPMSPILVDKGAIYKKQAEEQVARLSSFKSEAEESLKAFIQEERKKLDEFEKTSQEDTKNFSSNVNKLAQALTAEGVSPEQLKASFFEMGFSNALKGLPPSHIQFGISELAKQLLAPENKEALSKVAGQMKHVFDVPTKEEVLQDVKAQIEEQAAAAGQQVPKEKLDELMKKYEPQAEKAVAKQKNQVESLKEQVKAATQALDEAGVPEEEKGGDMVLLGYLSGSEARKMIEQQQAMFVDMFQKMQGGSMQKSQ